MGSRNVAKGETAKKTILQEVPDKADMIEVVQIDVGNDFSVKAAAKSLRDRGDWFNEFSYAMIVFLSSSFLLFEFIMFELF